MFEDNRGLPFTTASAEAAGAFNKALQSYYDYKLSLGDHVKAALAADPEMPMANVMKGYMMMMFGSFATVPSARRSLAAAEAAAEGATERERGHMAALRAWTEGDLHGANRQHEAILAAHPHDLLALKLVNFSYFWRGDKVNVRDSVARVLPRWDEQTPGHGYLLGMHAFGMEECGDYEAAERSGRAAVEIHPGDLWATHAVAHVMEMQGRLKDGVEWLEGLKGNWDNINNFVVHLWWHRALYHLEMEQYDKVLELYDGPIREDESDFYMDMQNAVSLLWRLELRGLDVGNRWEEVADKSEQRIEDPSMPFSDMHYLMAMIRGGRMESARKLVAHRREYAASAKTSNAPIFGEVGVPVFEALMDFGEEKYGDAAEKFAAVHPEIVRSGGSHAQRDVFTQTMIAAALRAGRNDLAKDWLAERTRDHASSAEAWRSYAMVLEGSGDTAAANDARGRMQGLLG